MRSIDFQFINRESVERLKREKKGFIAAFWHNRILPIMWAERKQGVVTLVSRSRDGELIARALKKLGYCVVRGSSSKGIVSSTKVLIKELEEGRIVAIIPDGPRGPVYTVRPGIISLAQATGAPILPLTAVVSSYWKVNSWDGFMIPKPFSKVTIVYGEPIYIERNSDPEKETIRLRKTLFQLENIDTYQIQK